MKKYHFLLFALFSIVLFNCCKKSSDDNGVNPPPGNQNGDISANLLAAGASASDLLGNANFNDLLIEIAYVDGFRPTQEALDSFLAFLFERTFKQNIQFVFNEVPSPDKETLTLQEIADIETEHRTIYNDGTTLGLYIYFSDAPSDDDDEEENLVTLGAVYRNTSMVIYESTIQSLASKSSLITNADVEMATLNHEAGHLFGLVDLGTTPVNNHEDSDAANHCNVVGCLMRAELQFGGGIMSILESRKARGSAPAPGLDAECILDLQSNGGR